MKIAIDIQGAQSLSRSRGIGRYTFSLIKAILENQGAHEIIIIFNGYFLESVNKIKADLGLLLREENIKIWYPPGDTSFIDGSVAKRKICAEIIREFFIAEINPDILLVCSLFEGLSDPVSVSIKKMEHSIPTAVILYDLIPLIHQEMYLPSPVLRDWYFDRVDNIKRADLLLSISESSRKEAIEHLDFEENKVVNISAAADDFFRPILISPDSAKAFTLKFGLNRPFLMYTGGLDNRKNLDRLILAYAALDPDLRAKHQLAIVCDLGIHKENFEKLCFQSNLRSDEVIFTGYVSEQDLLHLYNLCLCFIFPSWHEGFGLPLLEAMSCGRAVIGSNLTSIPEVIDCELARFDPYNTKSIAEVMSRVLTDHDFRKMLECRSSERIKYFSWQLTAAKAIEALELYFQKFQVNKVRQSPMPLLSMVIDKIVSMDALPDSEAEIVRLAHSLSLTFPFSKIN